MKHIKLYILLVLVGVLSASCDKNGLVTRREEASLTRLMFVHAVPEAIQFNFFVNDVKYTGAVVNTSTLLPQGMGYNTANQPAFYGYCNIPAGNSKIKAIVPQEYVVAPGDVIATGAMVLETNLTVEENQSYSIFAYGTAKAVSSLILKDKLVTKEGKAGIRFVNLNPSTINADLEMTFTPTGSTVSTTTKLASNIPHTGYTEFFELDPGTYVFQRRRAGTTTATGTALTITRLNAGQNFTLCARGALAAITQIPHQ